jgi:hypothetical protein
VPDTGRSLADRLEALVESTAVNLDGIDRRSTGGSLDYSVDGRLFAVRDGGSLDVNLGAAIASAALRTADTHASPRGPGWVRFTPRLLDRFASDRVRAWFEAAWRRASGLSGAGDR